MLSSQFRNLLGYGFTLLFVLYHCSHPSIKCPVVDIAPLSFSYWANGALEKIITARFLVCRNYRNYFYLYIPVVECFGGYPLLVVCFVVPAIPAEPSATRAYCWRKYITTAVPAFIVRVCLGTSIRTIIIYIKDITRLASLVA